MYKAYKYRLYPNKSQKELITKHMGCVRFVYNWALNMKISAYQKDNLSLSRFDLQKELPVMKKTVEYSWLKEVNSQSLQVSLENLDKAYTNFFRDKKGFPKFKSKDFSNKSFAIPQKGKVDFDNNKFYAPKFKQGIRCKFHREFDGVIKTCTVSQTPTNKYFVSVLVETFDTEIVKAHPKESNAIGIDLGLKDFATISNGEVISNPKFLSHKLSRLKVLQKRASKKKEGSCNRKKANLLVAKQYETITNQRTDFLHKLSSRLISENQTICLEDLAVKNMMKRCKAKKDESGNYIPNGQSAKKGLNKSISDVGWYKFNCFLEYKADWYGVNILRIGRFEPSSKMCSCGVINKELKLSDRVWECRSCGIKNNRDELAANNIKHFAFHPQNKSRLGRPVAPVEMSSLEESAKQES